MDWRLLIALALAAEPQTQLGPDSVPAPDTNASVPAPTRYAGPGATGSAEREGSTEIVPGPTGLVRVTEIGHPPLGMTGPTARSVARKNALTRARESLLRTILKMQTRDGRKVGDILRQSPEHKPGLRSVLERASAADVELHRDAVEITLTVRMDGENGLGRYLDALQSPATGDP